MDIKDLGKMTLRLIILSLLLSVSALRGATYYIATTGSDSNGGTNPTNDAWATYTNAAVRVSAGDTVLVQPGIYTYASNIFASQGTCAFARPGVAASNITFRAAGPVTNWFSFDFRAPYYYVDGFTFELMQGLLPGILIWGPKGGAIEGPGSGNMVITNCTFQNMINASGIGMADVNAPGTNKIVNCTFRWITNQYGTLILRGISNVVQGCTFADMGASVALSPFGTNNLITGNLFTNISNPIDGQGYGKHPDVFQMGGEGLYGAVGNVIENNLIVDCQVELMQLTMDGLSDTNAWGFTFRNNIILRCNGQCSIDMSNLKIYNNSFLWCNNGAALLAFAWYDPYSGGNYRGSAYGCEVVNNVFYACSGAYGIATSGYNHGALTPTGGGATGSGDSYYYVNGYENMLVGAVWTNTTGTATSISIFQTTSPFTVLTNIGVSGNSVLTNIGITYGLGGLDNDGVWNLINNEILGIRINTTVFPSGELVGYPVFYVPTPPIDLVTNHNWINAGDARFVSPGVGNVRLLSDSPLIDAGTNISSVSKDYYGTSRPQGSAFDIGAVEYNGGTTAVGPSLGRGPNNFTNGVGARANLNAIVGGTLPVTYQWAHNGSSISGATLTAYSKDNLVLIDAGSYAITASNAQGVATSDSGTLVVTTNGGIVLHYDFEGITATGVPDVSGNGHDAIQFNSTNNITQVDGVFGTKAGQWTYSFTQSDGSGHAYPASQYLAVTNVAGIEYLTNGTISFWAQFDTNSDSQMLVMDNGYNPEYASGSSYLSWSIGRFGSGKLYLAYYPSTDGVVGIVSWPNDVDRNTLSTTNFHLYSATFDPVGGQSVAYYDGQPYQTNAIIFPFLKVYGTAGQPWLCLGAMSHDGTPQWGDDAYPNSGYFVGKMDDVRIYNRTLSATEVSIIYTNGSIGGPVTNPTPAPTGLTLNVGTLRIGH